MKIEILDILLNTVEKTKKFTDITNRFNCNVDVTQGRYTVDGKSIMGVLSLNLVEPVSIKIESCNEEEIDNFMQEMEEFR